MNKITKQELRNIKEKLSEVEIITSQLLNNLGDDEELTSKYTVRLRNPHSRFWQVFDPEGRLCYSVTNRVKAQGVAEFLGNAPPYADGTQEWIKRQTPPPNQ